MRVNRFNPGRTLRGAWFALALGLWAAGSAYGQTVTVEAMLIHASDRPAALDTRLDRVEFRLRRIFGFEHYGFMGEKRSVVTLPSQSRLDLGHGYTLRLNTASRDGRVQAEIEWFRGDERLLRTSVTQRRGVPSILGGPPHDEGTLILVLEFK